MELKKYICTENKNIKHTENQDAAVNLKNLLALDPLHKTKDSKTEGNEYCYYARPIGDPDTFSREVDPLLKIQDAYPKMVIARTRNPEYQYEGVKIVDVADWLLNK